MPKGYHSNDPASICPSRSVEIMADLADENVKNLGYELDGPAE